MKLTSLIFLLISFLLFTDCKTKSKTESQSGINNNAAKEVKITYRLVVSFISHASGIDGEKYDAIEAYLKKHPKKPKYDVLLWGREGERDFCFHLKEFKSDEQSGFIDELKKLAVGSERVQFHENVERVKKQ